MNDALDDIEFGEIEKLIYGYMDIVMANPPLQVPPDPYKAYLFGYMDGAFSTLCSEKPRSDYFKSKIAKLYSELLMHCRD